MTKLKLIESTEKPSSDYLEVTPELVIRLEKLLTDIDNQVNEINEIFKKVGYTPKYKIEP